MTEGYPARRSASPVLRSERCQTRASGGVGEVQQIVRPDRHRQIGGVEIGEQHVVVRPEDHLVRNARRAQSGADRGVDVHLLAGILIGAADETEAGKSGRFAAGNQIDVAVVAEMFLYRAQCDAQFVVRLRRTVGPQRDDEVDRSRHRPRTGLELAARLFPRFGGTCRRGTGTAAGRRLEGGGPFPSFAGTAVPPAGFRFAATRPSVSIACSFRGSSRFRAGPGRPRGGPAGPGSPSPGRYR
ncbi:MAG: hypothetical protein L6W00_08065 [Lentisphaeria bacterium]|nr:MAG: hypothetical protein L6W00_08065 [Lentisphaeria bacterium]